MKSFGPVVKYIRQQNQGTPGALNRGILDARGALLAFLDADDIWVDNRLNWQTDLLHETPDCDFVLGTMQDFYSPDLSESEKEQIYCPMNPMSGYCPGAMLIRRNSFNKVGLFSTNYSAGEFLEWFIRARELQLKYKIDSRLALKRRVHSTNKTRIERHHSDYLKIIRQSLKRK